MKAAEAPKPVSLKTILYLTDFSESSAGALPFAASIARACNSTICILHVLVPSISPATPGELSYAAPEIIEECADKDMRRVACQLKECNHTTIIEKGSDVWGTLQRIVKEREIDLVVLGTRGRTCAEGCSLGSVAEEVFRHSEVPILTIGPLVPKGYQNSERLRRILFATDFTAESFAAAPYAVSLAQKHGAQLILLHVIGTGTTGKGDNPSTFKARLAKIVPDGSDSLLHVDTVVAYGDPTHIILETAKQQRADLIVLGIGDGGGHLIASDTVKPGLAHQVATHATCPVLTVRG